MTNGLVSRLCAYLLNDIHSARELLLAMSNAHKQMSYAEESVKPPLFGYAAMPGESNGLYLTYDSPRQLCPLLIGAIEGAAERYGELSAREDVLATVLAALRALDVNAVISTGIADRTRLGPCPEHWHVAPSLPQVAAR